MIAAGDADSMIAEHGDDRRRGAFNLASDDAPRLAHGDADERGPFFDGQDRIVIIGPPRAELQALGPLLREPPLAFGFAFDPLAQLSALRARQFSESHPVRSFPGGWPSEQQKVRSGASRARETDL